MRPHPPRALVNLAGSWGDCGLWAGGRVLDNGAGVTRVRLSGPGGLVLEDVVDGGHALFMTERPFHDPEALTAELFAAAGQLVGSHGAFFPRRQARPG